MANGYSLDQYRTDQEKLLKQRQDAAKQAAYANNQKLLKYLPQRTAGQSVGMTESARIAANSAYQQNVVDADNAYLEGMSDLNNYVRTEQERLDDKAKAEQERLDDKAKAEQNEAFNRAKAVIESGNYNTSADLRAYIDTFKNKVSDAQWSDLNHYVTTIESDPNQLALDEEYNGTVTPQKDENGKVTYQITGGKNLSSTKGTLAQDDKFLWWGGGYKAGDNFTISVGENDYRVQSGGEADAASTAELKKKHKEAKDGEVVKYGDTLYLYKNGKYYIVEKRPSSSDYNELFNAFA